MNPIISQPYSTLYALFGAATGACCVVNIKLYGYGYGYKAFPFLIDIITLLVLCIITLITLAVLYCNHHLWGIPKRHAQAVRQLQ